MDTTEYRALISETFTKCFAVSLQTETPRDYVEELFISFVLSALFSEKRKPSTGKLDERFIYECIPKFINWLTLLAADKPSYDIDSGRLKETLSLL